MPTVGPRSGEAIFASAERVNAELFTLTYGAVVRQLLTDLEEVDQVNKQLDLMGYNIGVRLIDEFLAKSNVSRCVDFKETAEVIAKVGLKMFLGVTATVTNWDQDGTTCSLVLEDNPLVDFVELPDTCQGLHYCNVLSGVIRGALEMILSLGGVGSHAASMLLRSGVGKLLIVDFDQVSLSSLNRHAVATRDDVGMPKALCLKKHFMKIFPECEIDAQVALYNASTEENILAGNPDFVLDCIDNIDTKVALLAACVRRGLKVLCATGAGARADPTRIRIADLRESTNDPLSRSVRHRLKRDHGIEGGIPVVFSLEKPKVKLLPFKGLSGEEENPSDYQVVPGFRVRIIPVLGSVPAIFGQIMASYVITKLGGFQIENEPVVHFDMEHYRTLHQRLIEHEELVYGTANDVQVDVEEVMYVTKELWRGRSAKDQSIKDVGRAMWRSVNELMLIRWDRTKPASVSNLILLKFDEVDEHESMTLDEISEKEPEFFQRVSDVLKRATVDFGL